jgi:hypothetical protein
MEHIDFAWTVHRIQVALYYCASTDECIDLLVADGIELGIAQLIVTAAVLSL